MTKMKKVILQYSIVFAIIFALSSCGKDFLDVQPKGTLLEENFYQNEGDAFEALIAVYDQVEISVEDRTFNDHGCVCRRGKLRQGTAGETQGCDQRREHGQQGRRAGAPGLGGTEARGSCLRNGRDIQSHDGRIV